MIIDCIFNLSYYSKKGHGEHEKVMFFTSFSIKGIVYVNVLSPDESFTGEYFASNILPHLKEAANKI